MKRLLLLLIFILSFILRIYKFGENPPSLYWDEASLGYNAYSIATSLKDEHGELLPSARFIAFGDYKPPGYIYFASIPIKLLGLNEFTVRLPSLLAGVGLIILTYFLSKELFRRKKIVLLATYIIGISPWGIHFSRAAFEANLAAFFNLAGIYLFILSLKRKHLIILSFISFVLSFYTFNANRITAPLMIFVLSVVYFREIWQNKKWLIISSLVAFLLVLPSISFLLSPEGKLRFQEVSIFTNLEPVKVSNELIFNDGGNIFAKIIHNRRIIFSTDFLKHYTDNFSLRFLFTHGDVNPRLAIPEMGQLYPMELPFLLLGLYYLFKEKRKIFIFIFAWMLIAPIPAGTARETPHALRIISILPTYQILIGYGIYCLLEKYKEYVIPTNPDSVGSVEESLEIPRLAFYKLRLARDDKKLKIHLGSCFIFILYALNIFYYLHNYYKHFPYDWSGEWQYGYKEMVNYVLENEDKYDHIYVTNALGRPYIFFAFYKPFSNDEFLKEAEIVRDRFGFYDVKRLGKISFEWDNISSNPGKLLQVTTTKNLSPGFTPLKSIKNLNNDTVFYFSERI